MLVACFPSDFAGQILRIDSREIIFRDVVWLSDVFSLLAYVVMRLDVAAKAGASRC